MRPLELTLALALAIRILFIRRAARTIEYLPVLIGLLQIWIEGYRWQMLPMYALTIGAGLISVRNLDPWKPAASPKLVRAGILGGSLILLATAAVPWVLPIPATAPPSGHYAAGTRTLYLIDQTRTDPYAPQPDAPRELMVQIWYPAQAVADGGADPAPWMANAEIIAPAIAAQLGLPSYFLDHLVYAKTSAYTNLPIAATGAPFPVILFSHGYGGFRAQNTSQAQDLASHGFVVAAVEHPYASAITVFPDGRLALKNPDTLPEGLDDAAYEAAAETLVAQWTADLIFALDTLAAMNAEPDSPFAGRLDLARVGVMGHSTGGGAAVQFCAQEPRCAAGLGMDAWLLPVTGDVMAGGLDQPFLYMFSEEWSVGPNHARFADLSAASAGAVVTFTIEGSAHYDFTDLPALSPLAANLGLKGPIDAGRVMSLVTGYTAAFFDIHLRGGDPAQLSALAQAYPEAAYP